ncbi:MAG TPA: HD-GYP domain-containing protein [Acidimicrobiales bacterium]|nr:HD-GYP domain-containing protein [Acidimicrobiales bacterium]
MKDTIAMHCGLASAFGNAVASYDIATFDHSQRVVHLALKLGDLVGVDGPMRSALGWAGILHDLGKLCVSEAILRKPGPLTAEEWEEVKLHPVVGFDILMRVSDRLEPVATAVRGHHERWDGTGYPDGLAGEDVPLLARIVTLADVYDALTHSRPYRQRPFTPSEAKVRIDNERGCQFDPQLVPLFLRVLEREVL